MMVASRLLVQYEVESSWIYSPFSGPKQSFSDECKMHKSNHAKASTISPENNADMNSRTAKVASGKANAEVAVRL